MEKTFDPGPVEERIYCEWLRSSSFAPQIPPWGGGGIGYAIMMPPPNVTGVLHMGHLLNNTLQDILVRSAHRRGKAVLWQPGTDHAGISLQVRVEKDLREKGIDAKALSREEFLWHAERWRDEHGDIILQQLRKLGVCCDLTRKVHTLDSDYSRTVLHGFVELYRRGHIYRGHRMVHWCPVSQTALSDEEVFVRECDGFLWRVRYELVDDPSRAIEICTTRPETIGGDVAIAVHPDDPRYGDLIGKKCWRPFPREPIPIIADGAVDRSFGSGALKITPAHAAVDFEIGQRHGLPFREVMDPSGTMNDLAGEGFAGLDRSVARERAVASLRELGCLVSVEPHRSAVGISERSGRPVEPRLSEQWFLRYPNVDLAKRAVEEGHIRLFPSRWEKIYLHWLNNIHDWCISRQLRWGHRIPVWYRRGAGRGNPAHWHVSIDGPADPENWEQDEDVLDTWFSSAFWPLGTLGWPDPQAMAQKNFSIFFPTHTLVTGPDIIFFWVARMVLMAVAFLSNGSDGGDLGQIVPFRNVCFTGIVRDSIGRKMSKSLGNSPDPLELIDRYGTDSVRFGLISSAPLGQDILFEEKNIELGRNFCTKLWNACRFRLLQGGPAERRTVGELLAAAAQEADFFDRAMVQMLYGTFMSVNSEIEGSWEVRDGMTAEFRSGYSFQSALQRLERFFRDDYCDFYVELCKWRLRERPQRKAQTLALQDFILRTFLQLLAPFTPFICQELWQQLGFGVPGEALHLVPLPDLQSELERAKLFPEALEWNWVVEFRAALTKIRALPGAGNGAVLRGESLLRGGVWEELRGPLLALTGHKSLDESGSFEPSLATVHTPWGRFAVARQTDEFAARLREELARVRQNMAANRTKLEDPTFLARAPERVIEGAKKLLAENCRREAQLLAQLGEGDR
ncbi:MAG: valine--tRNA ligase [Puniceicoccales bacterium]|jgi:valyl-tRNA synthetase|nr:valine--tRNA ligase [Puniceicoccales bacterium]